MTDTRSHGDVPLDPQETSQEKAKESEAMKVKIEQALSNPEIRSSVAKDFAYTFHQLGLSDELADKLCESIFSKLLGTQALDDIEKEILLQFKDTKIETLEGPKNLIEILDEKLKARAHLIFSQVKDHLSGIKGKVFDYGAGDGQVTQKLHDDLGLDIEGADVRSYVGPGVSVPMSVFNGKRVEVPDKYFEAGVMTNVAHHEKDNEQILKELDRIISNRLVILETVPVGSNADEISKDKERTFMNDYLYNRLFHNANISVPGTYETPQGWIDRFSKYGWKVKESQDLGYDQPTIKDVHHLLVLER